MIVVLGHLLIVPLSEHEISNMCWMHVNSLTLFVSSLAVNRLPNAQVLSHLLAWYCVGVSVEGWQQVWGDCENSPRVYVSVTWVELMWPTSEHECRAYVTSVWKCKSLCGEQAIIKDAIFLSVTNEAWGDWVDGHAARYSWTIVTALVVWTDIWYEIGSPSFGTKSVGTLEAILTQERGK